MRKTIPLAVVVATLALATIVTGLVRGGNGTDRAAAVAPVAQIETVMDRAPARLRVNSFGAI